jgi:hypothetical protein
VSRRHAAAFATCALLVGPALALATEQRTARPSLALVTARSKLVLRQGRAQILTLRVRRTNGLRGRVTLDSWRLPPGARALWLYRGRPLPRKRSDRHAVVLAASARTAVLRIAAAPDTRVGRVRFRISALARHRRSRRWVTLIVVPARWAPTAVDGTPFIIRGRVAGELSPGAGAPLELEITNPTHADIALTDLHVSLEERTSRPGCDAAANYDVRQFTGPYPVAIPAGTSDLAQLAGDRSLLPVVVMRDLPVNQDICKGAVLTLQFHGVATG